MDFAFSDADEALRREILELGRAELGSIGPGQLDLVRWAACGRHRLQGLAVAEEHGGRGLDALSTAIALEALGYACDDGGLVFSLCAHLLACAVPIGAFGSELQKSRLLPGLSDGTRVGGLAMTEPDAGSDISALRTRAEPDAAGFRLFGHKRFVTNVPAANLVIVFAATDARKGAAGGTTAFLVNTSRPGVSASPPHQKLGLAGSPLADLILDGVVVGPDDVLGGIGGGSAVFTLAMSWERICLVAAHVGKMERLLERSMAQLRAAPERPAHHIADRKVALEAARLLVYRAAWKLARQQQVGLDASLAKLFVSEALVAAADDAWSVEQAITGLASPSADSALCDALASTIYSGTSELQRHIIARWLGL